MRILDNKNIRLLFLNRIFVNINLFAFIYFLYYRLLGFTFSQIFILSAIAASVTALAALISGPMMNILGFKKSYMSCWLLFIAGVAIFAFAPYFGVFVLATVLITFSGVSCNNMISAFLRQLCVELSRDDQFHDSHMKLYFLSYMVYAISALVSGLFLLIDVRVNYYITLGSAILAFISLFFIQGKSTHGRGFLRGRLRRHIFHKLHVTYYVLMISFFYFMVLAFDAFEQAYFIHVHLHVIFFGFVYCAQLLLCALGVYLLRRFKDRLRYKLVLCCAFALYLIVFLVLALFQNVYLSILIAFVGIIQAMISFISVDQLLEFVPEMSSASAIGVYTAFASLYLASFLIEGGVLIDYGYLNVVYYILMGMSLPAIVFLFLHHHSHMRYLSIADENELSALAE